MKNRLQAEGWRLKQVAQTFLSVCLIGFTVPTIADDAAATDPAAEAAPVELPPIVDPNPAQALQYAEIEVARFTAKRGAIQQQFDVIRLELEKANADLAQAQGALRLVTAEAQRASAGVTELQSAVTQTAGRVAAQEAVQQQLAAAAQSAQQTLTAAQESLAKLAPALEQARQTRDDALAAKAIVDVALQAAGLAMIAENMTQEQQAAVSAALQQAQQAQILTNRLAADATAAQDALASQTTAATDSVAQSQASYDQALNAQTQSELDLTTARSAHATAQAGLTEFQLASTQSQAALAIVQARIDELTSLVTAQQERLTPVQTTLTTMQSALDVSTRRRDAFAAALPVADPTQMREVAVYQEARPLMCVGFDPAGEYIFAGAQDNTILRWRIWDQDKDVLTGHASWPSQLVVASTGTMYSTGHEGTLLSWNALADAPAPISTIAAHEGFARALAVSPDGTLVVTVGNDNKAKVWNAADGSFVTELVGHESHIYSLAFHPSGEYLVTGDLKGVLKQWRVATWEFVRDLNADVVYKYDEGFQADVGGVRGICFSPDGTRLAVGGMGNVTNAFAGIGSAMGAIFNFETGERLTVMSTASNFEGTIWGMEFDPHGQYIVAVGGGNSGALWFWRPGEEKSFHQFDLPGIAYDVAVHPDGLKIAVALYDNTVRVYELLADPLAPPVEAASATE